MAYLDASATMLTRYARQVKLFPHGEADQLCLQRARLLVVGAGGLAAGLLPSLVGAGCGSITLVDPDCVEESNLHRQTLFRNADIGLPKATCIARHLRELNADSKIDARIERLTPSNAPALVAAHDLTIDSADSIAVTYPLSDACRDLDKPFISASAIGMRGYVGGFCRGAPSYRAVFPESPPGLATCDSAGVLGPTVAMIGALQAQMAISLLTNTAETPLGILISHDFENWRSVRMRFHDAPEPMTADPKFIDPEMLLAEDQVFDLRDSAPVSGHLFLDQARRVTRDDVARIEFKAGRVVFVCRRGIRAWAAARYVRERWKNSVAIIAMM